MFKLGLALSAGVVLSQTVNDYCTALTSQCPSHGLNMTTCATAFNNVPLGALTDVGVNTIGCRAKFLAPGANMNCAYAGVTGGGRCGDPVAGVCQVAVNICGAKPQAAYADVPSCLTGLGAVGAQWGSAYGSASDGEDSLECRSYHAVASLTLGDVHCGHYTADVTAAGLPCTGRVSVNATRYCENLQFQCNGTNAQFGELAQCLKVAASYPTSSTDDARGTNSAHSLGCRQYHAQASQSLPSLHCQHAGPSGGRVCGTPRAAWGTMFAASPCNNSHVQEFLNLYTNVSIVDAMVPSGFSDAAPYSAGSDTGGNTQACRIYHLGVASTLPETHCVHGSVSGGGACGSYASNLCTLIGQACGFGGNATWQFPSMAACTTDLTGLAAGTSVPKWASADNTAECRFYHASVAGSFAAGGANSGTAGAMANQILHCSHVLKKSAPGGCEGLVPTPAPAANSATTSGLSLFAVAIFVYTL